MTVNHWPNETAGKAAKEAFRPPPGFDPNADQSDGNLQFVTPPPFNPTPMPDLRGGRSGTTTTARTPPPAPAAPAPAPKTTPTGGGPPGFDPNAGPQNAYSPQFIKQLLANSMQTLQRQDQQTMAGIGQASAARGIAGPDTGNYMGAAMDAQRRGDIGGLETGITQQGMELGLDQYNAQVAALAQGFQWDPEVFGWDQMQGMLAAGEDLTGATAFDPATGKQIVMTDRPDGSGAKDFWDADTGEQINDFEAIKGFQWQLPGRGGFTTTTGRLGEGELDLRKQAQDFYEGFSVMELTESSRRFDVATAQEFEMFKKEWANKMDMFGQDLIAEVEKTNADRAEKMRQFDEAMEQQQIEFETGTDQKNDFFYRELNQRELEYARTLDQGERFVLLGQANEEIGRAEAALLAWRDKYADQIRRAEGKKRWAWRMEQTLIGNVEAARNHYGRLVAMQEGETVGPGGRIIPAGARRLPLAKPLGVPSARWQSWRSLGYIPAEQNGWYGYSW
jgi:hypothetical protein